ncbi:serine/threonine-protein kinase [Paraburkholderia sp. J76]|uniref:serine/threonine-protein kinase n=1 Tax=Paraburkholderia sp. J76 TaxID=2805439 RepID=UPI002ABDD87F|nr:serine/threonine-protein kinase [Paraburkholderia sp. J76]
MRRDTELPATFDRYVIERVLGRGAMGVVYLAFDPRIERHVALKTLQQPAGGKNDHELTARFLNEARAAGRLAHPHIVAVYDYGETGDTAFITMEYVRGETLAAHLAQHARAGTRMNPLAALRWFAQLLDALDYAHGSGIVHRDIKPANLLISPRGECKVADFGIAQLDASTLTQTGTLLGTPAYMSPEQFTGEAVDARSDLFSGAVVLYEMLSGVCPFTGTPGSVMRKILDDTPPPPSSVVPALPAYVDELVMKGMEKHPQERYGCAREWRDKLISLLAADSNEDTERTVLSHERVSSPIATPSPQTQLDPELIAHLERRLASHVGPVASLLIRRACAGAANIDTLRERLSAHLPNDEARRDFDSLMLPAGAGMPRVIGAQTISAENVNAAATRLTTLLGPIARIVARRAAARAADLRSFYAQLLDAVPERHREALRREWGVEVD